VMCYARFLIFCLYFCPPFSSTSTSSRPSMRLRWRRPDTRYGPR
jgi:hypothetical protein